MALDLLARSGRKHWAGVAVSTLSQGQRQMLCLMSVLAMEPATVLLDEPFASLDMPARLRLARVLAGMGQRVVMISHDPAALEGMERVLWLEGGRILRDGSPAAVLPEFKAEMMRLGEADADTDLAG